MHFRIYVLVGLLFVAAKAQAKPVVRSGGPTTCKAGKKLKTTSFNDGRETRRCIKDPKYVAPPPIAKLPTRSVSVEKHHTVVVVCPVKFWVLPKKDRLIYYCPPSNNDAPAATNSIGAVLLNTLRPVIKIATAQAAIVQSEPMAVMPSPGNTVTRLRYDCKVKLSRLKRGE